MTKTTKETNFRVEVYPRGPGDYGSFSIGGTSRTAKEERAVCEDIAAQIRRHVDDLPTRGNRGVEVIYDEEDVCSYCGSGWTEDSDEFNGGCCAKDMEHEPEAAA